MNCNNPVWSDAEKDVVDNAWNVEQALWEYRLAFGYLKRTYEAIKRRWYRMHVKVTV
jgi:hypothetical protein